jgi:predicted phosphodiesterase|tara:strand:+ start:273 stop:431 length:159 start_codon:yes stop_codon:yes gene_type:complete
MKLLTLSDLHLDSAEFQMPEGLDFDAIVVAGDLWDSGPHGVNYLDDFDFNRG